MLPQHKKFPRRRTAGTVQGVFCRAAPVVVPEVATAGLHRFFSAVLAHFPPSATWQRVGGLLSRLLAGVGGGYAVAALFTAVLSSTLPMARSEAVLTATMASFAVHAAVIIWAFAARSALRASAGVLAIAALLVLALYLPRGYPS